MSFGFLGHLAHLGGSSVALSRLEGRREMREDNGGTTGAGGSGEGRAKSSFDDVDEGRMICELGPDLLISHTFLSLPPSDRHAACTAQIPPRWFIERDTSKLHA